MSALTQRLRCALAALGLTPLVAPAAPLDPDRVPGALRAWVPWVLYGEDQRACPRLEPAEGDRRCVWPTRLALDLDQDGGAFRQTWQVHAPGWVRLPGDARHWPQAVTLEGSAAVVVEREAGPALWLTPGVHQASGRFEWRDLPESLQLPAEVGLLALTVDGAPVVAPVVEPDGRLWLKARAPAGAASGRPADTLEARVFRRLVDDVPFEVLTRVELEVAGEPREVLLGPALLEAAAIPVALESPLPARLEADGRLRLQVRPGRWVVTLAARAPGPVGELWPRAATPPWPDAEVWVLEARPHLRLVEPAGLEALDPTLTTLPADWHGRPTFRARPGERLVLAERRRGDPDPEPDRLELARTVWLDFAGAGATVRDRIAGSMTRGWRLEALAPLRLGRVTVDGQDRLVTRLPAADRAGVEVRRGRLEVVADSRLEGDRSWLPAAGWAPGFHRVGMTLNLPAGWRLLVATGADRVEHAWLTRWTLFELFVVLVASAAVGKLWGLGWGAVALGAFGLGHHEPGMSVWPWLSLLGAVALLRVLPSGRLRGTVRVVHWGSLVAVTLLALPYLVDQVRIGLYPALERPWQVVSDEPMVRRATEAPSTAAPAPSEAAVDREALARALSASPGVATGTSTDPARLAADHDPTAAVQTGPGLPRWTWEAVQLAFDGPVAADARVRLVLLPPAAMLAWRLLAAGLLAALLARALLPGGRSRRGVGGGGAPASVTAGLLVLAVAALLPAAARAEFPPDRLLDELRERLLAPPECAPRCAEVPRMRMEVAAGRLTLRLEVLASTEVAVPLPRPGRGWSPAEVLLDGEPAAGLSRDRAGTLWLALPAGAHQVHVEGWVVPGAGTLELSLPLRPRRVEALVSGWRLEGLDPDGVPEAALRLTSEQAVEPPLDGPGAVILPALLRVERTLRLGLDWHVETRVVRVSPPGVAVVAEVPLLAGESVTTPGLRVVAGRAQVSLAPQQPELGWSATLARAGELRLTAPTTTDWTEVWRLEAGPTWHISLAGLAPVFREARERWLPEWRPWPGETLVVQVARPEAVAGPTLTLEGAQLRVRPGQRATGAGLELRLRSTQGGQTSVGLPAGAELESVTVDGLPHPARQEGGRVVLPVRPGEQRLTLAWREPRGMGVPFAMPAVDLGHPTVNLGLTLEVPRDRWVLGTWGPDLGPAVLFWGVLAVVLVLALALGRWRLTPLRSWHWLLLGVGLTQAPVWSAVLVAGWLLALGARVRGLAALPALRFDLLQIGLALLTLVALALLLDAVRQGLLGLPEMQVAGNGSSGYLLRWYQDRAGPVLPRAGVVSVPLWVYRLLMLAWALWLAFALLGWLRWGWECYRAGALWRPLRLPRGRPAT